MERPRLEVRALTRRFGGVLALDSAGLVVRPGEIHALCGANGAGKSTLIRVLAGAVIPDSGSVFVDGEPLVSGSVLAAERAGIAVVHQEPMTFPDLDACENVFLMREKMFAVPLAEAARCSPSPRRAQAPRHRLVPLLDRRRMERETAALLADLGQDVDLRAPVGGLPLQIREIVSVARALARRPRLLVLDEPTAALTREESDALFRVVRRLRDDGGSVLYVSHRLDEVFALADRVTVLRDGRAIETRDTAALDKETLIRLMVGSAVEPMPGRPVSDRFDGTEPVLVVRDLAVDRGAPRVSFSVRRGEIVGLFGLVGAGRSRLVRTIAGIRPRDAGDVVVDGRRLRSGSVRDARRRGVVFVPEDRRREGILLDLSIVANLTLGKLEHISRGGFLKPSLERALAEGAIRRLGIRTSDPRSPARTLSGGNQQRVVLGRVLAPVPRVLVLDEPTRGIDVRTKAEIHRILRGLAKEGTGIVFVSSEMSEVLSLGDRVLVLRNGALAAGFESGVATEEALLESALPDGKIGTKDAATTTTGRRRRPALASFLARREGAVLMLLGLALLAVGVANPAFVTLPNLVDWLVRSAPAAIVSTALLLVMATGEIDVSIGSLFGLLGATLGTLASPSHAGLPPVPTAFLVLALGAGVGLLNGILVTAARAPSIVVTLGTLAALRGLTEILMGGRWITDLPEGIRVLALERVAGVPLSLGAVALVAGLMALIARRTALGRRIFAEGSHPEAARLIGLSRFTPKLAAFTLTGFATGVAVLVAVPELSVVESGTGTGFELLVITCVVVGGASVRGGRGSVTGCVLAALLLGLVRMALVFLNLSDRATHWERAIQGAFILGAVLLDRRARTTADGAE